MPDSEQPAYPGPWSKSERLAGIKLDSFVKWWSPERCQEITVNWVPRVDTGPMTFEEEQRDERFCQAIQDLRHDLDRARESGWTFGELPKDIRKEPEPFSATMQYEFIEKVCLQPHVWCAFDHDGKSIKVRVFPPGRFDDKAEDGSGRGQNIVSPRKAEDATGDSVHDAAPFLPSREVAPGEVGMTGDETSGIPVAELYRRRVLDDPEVRDLAVKAGETSLSVPSGWRNLRLEPYTPERRARRQATRSAWIDHGFSALVEGGPRFVVRPTIPRGHRAPHVMVTLTDDEQAEKALHDVMMKRLNGMLAELRSGDLVVEGIKEPPSHDLARGGVAAGFWSRSSVRVDFERGLLGERRGKTIEVIYSDLRVIEAPGSSKHDGQASKSSAVKDCEQWLREQGEAPTMPKDGYWQIAKERFKGLSERGFLRAWANAVGDDPRWTRAGRKPKAPKA